MATDKYSPLVQDQTRLNEVKYSSRDFVTICDDLLRRLKIEYGSVYNDYADTDLGIMLRDLVAWAYSQLSWYLDRTASDCYLATARTGSAVERIVEQIAYKMTPAAASSTVLTLTFPNGTPSGFIMKDRWKYQNISGVKFESYAKITQISPLNAGDTLSVSVRQGETKIITYTADGSKNQTYKLFAIGDEKYLGRGTAEVWVDGSLWEEKNFLEFEQTNHYEISYLADPPIIRFGDGIAGNIPPVGAEVKIRFMVIDGDAGNVNANTINNSVDTLVVGGESVVFSVNNAARARGGTPPEDIDSAKKWAPVSFAARGAAITQADYESLANSYSSVSYGSVAKAYAVNPRSQYSDLVFTRLSDSLLNFISEFSTVISTLEDSIVADSLSMAASLNVIGASSVILRQLMATFQSTIGTAQSGIDNVRDSLVDVQARANMAVTQSTIVDNQANALRNYISGGGSDTEEILDYIDVILAASGSAVTEATNANNYALSSQQVIDNTIIRNMNDMVSYVADEGEMEDELDAIDLQTSTLSGLIGDIQTDVSTIDGTSAQLERDVGNVVDDMSSRIGVLFSDDCLSNFVQVPILSLDSDGNYTNPSIGLIASLQSYLNGIKEVTQVVEVIDGYNSVVLAEIVVIVSVLDAYVPVEVKSQIESVIIGLLKGRDFNSPLYLDSLYDAVKDIYGIEYVNIEITGPMGYHPSVIDSSGNLVPGESQVIALGTLSITDQNGIEIS